MARLPRWSPRMDGYEFEGVPAYTVARWAVSDDEDPRHVIVFAETQRESLRLARIIAKALNDDAREGAREGE